MYKALELFDKTTNDYAQNDNSKQQLESQIGEQYANIRLSSTVCHHNLENGSH